MDTQNQETRLNEEAKKYQKRMSNPLAFWFGMLAKLPSAVFWRLKVKSIAADHCEITIPYFWRSQNPFKSIYFAALAGAAELSTGALCQLAMAGKGKFSMLVVDFRAEYSKKANEKITFRCEQGLQVMAMLDQLEVGGMDQIQLLSVGKNISGDEVARFYVTWSFKRKA